MAQPRLGVTRRGPVADVTATSPGPAVAAPLAAISIG
jgi:hypothetical protein